MITKHPICPQRVRRTPTQFSWVDHRLVRDRYIESCSHPAAALYLFLVTVADCQGLSFYSDPSVMARLTMDQSTLDRARQNLVRIGLIAYEKPLYQVLAIDADPPLNFKATHRQPMDKPVSVGQLFKQIMGENS
jgi:hypothetical protein